MSAISLSSKDVVSECQGEGLKEANKFSEQRPVQLGLCCLNTELRGRTIPVFASRKMIIRTIKQKGIDALKSKILQNLKDILVMIMWNEMHGIRVFRLSSEMFPHKSNPRVEDYTFDFAKLLAELL